MNRFKCPVCGGNQYTSRDTAQRCVYCGHQELQKMDTLLEPEDDEDTLAGGNCEGGGVGAGRKRGRRRMSELKKCPFCGNANIFVGMDWELEGRDESDGTGFYAVVCNYQNGGCGASGGYRKTKEEAIAAWNNRESEVEHDG